MSFGLVTTFQLSRDWSVRKSGYINPHWVSLSLSPFPPFLLNIHTNFYYFIIRYVVIVQNSNEVDDC